MINSSTKIVIRQQPKSLKETKTSNPNKTRVPSINFSPNHMEKFEEQLEYPVAIFPQIKCNNFQNVRPRRSFKQQV